MFARHSLVAWLLLVGSQALGAADAKEPSARPRTIRRRELLITDASVQAVHPIHVGKGTGTALTFEVPPKDPGGVLLADLRGRFFAPQLLEKSVVLVPKEDIPAREPITLTVTLTDGTVLVFQLLSVPTDVDGAVDVEVRLQKKASADSAVALKERLEATRAELDECTASSASAGESKVAALLAAQDLGKPHAWQGVVLNPVDRRTIRRLDKQSRLLVQARAVYRLLDLSFVVLTIENRDPAKTWVLGSAELSVGEGGWDAASGAGAGASQGLRVRAVAAEHPAVLPGEEGQVVISFGAAKASIPSAARGYSIHLFEKNGNRHVHLHDVNL